MMLQACLNGNRTQTFHPRVPCTADELARDARDVINAGADQLHLHPRNADGVETLEASHVALALAAIRQAVPAVPIGLSTHWAIPPGGVARQQQIGRWTILPEYVSVNLAEDDAPQVIALALQKGIGVEAGLSSVEGAHRFVALETAHRCLRVLIEIGEQDHREGRTVANAIIDALGAAGIALPQLLHGYEKTKWPLFRYAIEMGLDTRIGFEDGGCLPTGDTAMDNAQLIRAARTIMRTERVE
jgi:uncharacterized protein (DUF849 family)